MVKFVNRAKMTTSTTGTGTITLGSAADGYQSFADAGVSNGDTVRYVIEDGTNWEIGTGTYTASGTTLSRSVTESNNSDSAINLSGSASVFLAVASQDLSPTVTLDGAVTGSGTLTDLGDVTITTTATSDPTITLSGDASGSATLTNLGNATLSVTVADDSHNHVISNIDGLQSALDGKLSTSGNAATATTAGTVTTAAQPNITSVGTLTTLTVDDITINGSTISDAGNLTIDVGGDIILDADGADIKLFDGGTQFGQLYKSGNDFGLYSAIVDADIKLVGNDNGTVFTALQIDMSDAGTAIFNHDVSLNDNSKIQLGNSDDLELYHDATNSYISNDTGNLFIQSNNNIVLEDTAGNNMIHAADGGAVTLYNNGSSKFQTTSSGVNIDGNLNAVDNIYLATRLYHEGDTNTYFQFNTDGMAFVAGGGQEMSIGTSGVFLTNSALSEDYDALSGTTPTCNVTAGGMFSLTMSGNTTFTFSGAISGYAVGFILQLTGNGSTVTYPSSVDWAGGSAPDAPASGETDILVFISRDGGTTWYGALALDAAA
jgi:hypothetical protein